MSIEIRSMIKFTQRDGPFYVQPGAIAAIQPVKNGCKLTIAFAGEVFVNEGLDTVKRKLEGEYDPQ